MCKCVSLRRRAYKCWAVPTSSRRRTNEHDLVQIGFHAFSSPAASKLICISTDVGAGSYHTWIMPEAWNHMQAELNDKGGHVRVVQGFKSCQRQRFTHFGRFFGHVMLQIQDCRYSGIVDSWRRRPKLRWICLALHGEAGQRLALKSSPWLLAADCSSDFFGTQGASLKAVTTHGLPWLAHSSAQRLKIAHEDLTKDKVGRCGIPLSGVLRACFMYKEQRYAARRTQSLPAMCCG